MGTYKGEKESITYKSMGHEHVDGEVVYDDEWYSVVETDEGVFIYHKEIGEYVGYKESGMVAEMY